MTGSGHSLPESGNRPLLIARLRDRVNFMNHFPNLIGVSVGDLWEFPIFSFHFFVCVVLEFFFSTYFFEGKWLNSKFYEMAICIFVI